MWYFPPSVLTHYHAEALQQNSLRISITLAYGSSNIVCRFATNVLGFSAVEFTYHTQGSQCTIEPFYAGNVILVRCKAEMLHIVFGTPLLTGKNIKRGNASRKVMRSLNDPTFARWPDYVATVCQRYRLHNRVETFRSNSWRASSARFDTAHETLGERTSWASGCYDFLLSK